jgi:hypothetical protein
MKKYWFEVVAVVHLMYYKALRPSCVKVQRCDIKREEIIEVAFINVLGDVRSWILNAVHPPASKH